MATLDPYVETSWDTTSYVNPTNMNHIERGITNSRKAENIAYDSNNSVKDMIDVQSDNLTTSGTSHDTYINIDYVLAVTKIGNLKMLRFVVEQKGATGGSGYVKVAQMPNTKYYPSSNATQLVVNNKNRVQEVRVDTTGGVYLNANNISSSDNTGLISVTFVYI